MNPTVKATPVNSFATPYGSPPVPALTVVANMAPNEMNAPPITLNTKTVRRSVDTRRTPLCSARTAMSDGMMVSMETACGVLSVMLAFSSMCERAGSWADFGYVVAVGRTRTTP